MTDYRTAKNKYGTYCVPNESSHRGCARTILEGNVWEPETVDFMRQYIKGHDIVHAGTYFGDMLPALSEKANTVWAFEPSPINYQCALKTIEWNDLKNVVLHNKAVSTSNQDSVRFMVTNPKDKKNYGGGSRIPQENEVINVKTIDVSSVRIDDVVPQERKVSVIQLDVEGHEFAAIRGAINTIKRSRPILILESFKRKPMSDVFVEYLKGHNYKFEMFLHGNLNTVWVSNE